MNQVKQPQGQQIKIELDEDNTERLANVLTDTLARNNFLKV